MRTLRHPVFRLLAMLYFALIVALVTAKLAGQTSPRADQIRGIPTSSPEAAWCPGEPLKRLDAQTLAIGAAWTPAAPCYAHFNLTPPIGVDPISVSRFTAPATVTLAPGVWSDDLYIYLQAPAFAGSTVSRPQRIVVQSSSPGNVTCNGCIVETASTGLRIFPAFSMPVGLARVEGGTLHPTLDPIINSHQLYIGADLGVAVRRDGAGVWIELNRVTAQAEAQVMRAQLAVGSLEVARARQAAAAPLPAQRLAALERRMDAVQLDVLAAIGRIPATPAEVEALRQQVDELKIQAGRALETGQERTNAVETAAESRLQELEERYSQGMLHLVSDVTAGAACSEAVFGFNSTTPYLCEGGKWRRFQTKK